MIILLVKIYFRIFINLLCCMFLMNKKFKTYKYHFFQFPSVHTANLIVNKMVGIVLFNNIRIYIIKN